MRLVIASSLVILFSFSSLSASTLPPSFYEPLVDAQLVVRGVVEKVTPEHMPYHEWLRDIGREDLTRSASNYPYPIWSVRFCVREVLKGQHEGSSIDLLARRNQIEGDVALGEDREYILCLEYRSGLRGGTLYLRGNRETFSRSDGAWLHGSDGASYEMDDIRSTIQTTKLPYLITHADVIAVGRIRAIKEARVDFPDGRGANVREFTLDLTSLLKGRIDADTLTFKVVDTGSYYPEWRVHYPRNRMKLGETWYVFLKKNEEIGYYPFAGKNGLLKVEGADLIYDGAVKYPESRAQVDAQIRQESR